MINGAIGRDLSQRLRERLEFIEFRLYWEGSINRNDLTDRFGISMPQATLDLKEYQSLAPESLVYDVTKRQYTVSPSFKPKLHPLSPYEYLSQLEDTIAGKKSLTINAPPETASIPSFTRSVNPEVLRAVLSAFRQKKCIEIVYQSPKSPESTSRWVHPLVMVHALNRWHVRTFCYFRNGFRSFVLGRIIEITGCKEETEAIPKDEHWEAIVDVVFTPSPQLPTKAANIIEQDYDMTNGKVTVKVRRALLEYFLLENLLLKSKTAEPGENAPLREDNGQVAIQNVKAVQNELKMLRKNPT